MINEAQLFREIDGLREVAAETRDLVKAQNSRVRKLEERMAVQWFLWAGIGAVLLVVVPVILTHFVGQK